MTAELQLALDGSQHQRAFILVGTNLHLRGRLGNQLLGDRKGGAAQRQDQRQLSIGADRIGIKATLQERLHVPCVVPFKGRKEVCVGTRMRNRISNENNEV